MRIWIPVVLVIVAVGAGLYYFLVDPYMSRVIQLKLNDFAHSASIPEDLAEAKYLLSPQNGGGVYVHGELMYPDYVETGSIVTDMAIVGETEAKIRYEPVKRTHELVVNGQQLFSHPQVLRHLFLSPNGTHLSLAVMDGEGATVNAPESWTLRVIHTETGEVTEQEGFAGVFVDDNTLLVFRAEGVYGVDLSTGEEVVVSEAPITGAYTSLSFHKETSKIAWMTPFGTAFVSELLREPSLTILPIAQFAGAQGPLTLTEENLYILVAEERGGTRMFQQPIFSEAGATLVRAFPEILGMAKLIP